MAQAMPKKALMELGRVADRAYDEAEKMSGRSFTLAQVDAFIGGRIWPEAARIAGVALDPPDAAALSRLGGSATLYIDAADMGRVHGKVDDVFWGIGRRLMSSFDAEVARMAPDPASASPMPGR